MPNDVIRVDVTRQPVPQPPQWIYTNLAGLPAKSHAAPQGSKLAWETYLDGQAIAATVDFNKDGSPFVDPLPGETWNDTVSRTHVKAAGGSKAEKIRAPASIFKSFTYRVTLDNGLTDDPEIRVDPPDGDCPDCVEVMAGESGQGEWTMKTRQEPRRIETGHWLRFHCKVGRAESAFRVTFPKGGCPLELNGEPAVKSIADTGYSRSYKVTARVEGQRQSFPFTLHLPGLRAGLEGKIVVYAPQQAAE